MPIWLLSYTDGPSRLMSSIKCNKKNDFVLFLLQKFPMNYRVIQKSVLFSSVNDRQNQLKISLSTTNERKCDCFIDRSLTCYVTEVTTWTLLIKKIHRFIENTTIDKISWISIINVPSFISIVYWKKKQLREQYWFSMHKSNISKMVRMCVVDLFWYVYVCMFIFRYLCLE